MARPGLLVLLALTLAGCHLIDQTDFVRAPPAATAPAPPPVADPETRTALVTIDYEKANPDYRAPLSAVIKVVESRRPGVLYDVVAVVASAADAQAGRIRAAEVMTAIEGEGVIPARIQMALRLVPGQKIPQVRVYLR